MKRYRVQDFSGDGETLLCECDTIVEACYELGRRHFAQGHIIRQTGLKPGRVLRWEATNNNGWSLLAKERVPAADDPNQMTLADALGSGS
jgi:hypothetical protein